MKTLLVWLLLLAVPFQGFASATMLVCAPFSSTPIAEFERAAPAHAGAAGSEAEAAPAAHCAQMAAQQGDDPGAKKSGHQTSMKCSSCALCHVGMAIASHEIERLHFGVQQFSTIPFDLAFIAAVDLDLPERPPQTSLI
ncbi:hypothetical protein LPB67_15925 [Undibacterium sp. Jales W-56]|uniref:hypothetical protein n=1 Tax=Undibacterium sp. Jales W-56 TaxID=2897325 RepID=UPI0021D2C1FC|nr:hypothetical protein [Undibacterium sp. Jales W-56]MCU6435264.1 hypothetical protein [Undibacterium sp. Jales W-56]